MGTGSVCGCAHQGQSVALSSDGNTAMVGGYFDGYGSGATWVFTRSAGVWTQQGSKLVGTGAVGAVVASGGRYPGAWQGQSVSLSADGNTAVIGGSIDNNWIGATWVFRSFAGTWSQEWEANLSVRIMLDSHKWVIPSRCPPTGGPPSWVARATTIS